MCRQCDDAIIQPPRHATGAPGVAEAPQRSSGPDMPVDEEHIDKEVDELGFLMLMCGEAEGYAVEPPRRVRLPMRLDIGEAAFLVKVALEIRSDRGSPPAAGQDG